MFAAQVVVFSALGWAVAGILTIAGALKLSDALFVSGLIEGVVAGLIALESSDMPVSLPMRASQTLSLTGVVDRAGLGVGVDHGCSFPGSRSWLVSGAASRTATYVSWAMRSSC